MANKRNKKKLNSKQADRISLVISGVYFIFMLANGMIWKLTVELAILYLFVGCIACTLFVYFFLYFFIFKGEEREREERTKEIVQSLSDTEFKQVYFLAKGYGTHIDMMRQILEKEGCKFYAKLTEDKNIFLLVKDKYNEKVYSIEIKNYVYFYSNFKFEE